MPQNSKSFVRAAFSRLASVLLTAISLQLSAAPQSNQTQEIRLDAGWNLIAFQVLPAARNPASVFSSLGDNFVSAWGFSRNGNENRWTVFARPGTEQALANNVARMEPIDVGRAYWVYVNQAVPAWKITGTAPAKVPAVTLMNGWNLIAVPTGAGSVNEPISVGAVFAAAGLDYDTILRWESGLYDKFTPADGDEDDFTVFDLNKGYWVNVKSSSFSLQPKLLSSVRPDIDGEPQGNYPSFEDLKLSSSPTPLGPAEQTHIIFLQGEDTQQIAFANTGGGILLWRLEWTPLDAANTSKPWLQFSSTQGVTTIENDIVNLYLDRTYLTQGTYRGTLKVLTTAGDRTFQVVANVPGLAGEWRGAAVAESVNGRRNTIPNIDLHLSFYEDPTASGLIRGFIDSRNALLWPVDVPLVGHILDSAGNAFSLSGGYVLPPGDQNNPPYDQFITSGEDVDWNCDGKLDDLNPYPFPLYRSATLTGRLVSGSPTATNRYEISGRYAEVVYGLLRQPIRIEGSFSIHREDPKPFANRRPIINETETGTQPVVFKGLTAPLQIPRGRSTNTLNFITDMVLLDMAVDLDLDNPNSADLRVALAGPDGKQALLHDRMPISSLRNLSFPTSRRPVQSFDTEFIGKGASTKGNWKLVVENGGAPVFLKWALRLHGQPVFSLIGQVVDTEGRALAPQLSLNGMAIGEVVEASTDGKFVFSRLPGIPLNLSALIAGYVSSDPLVVGLDSRFTLPNFPSTCDTPEKRALASRFRPLPVMAFPAFGTAGLDPALGTPVKPVELRLAREAAAAVGARPALVAWPNIGPAPLEVIFELRDRPNSAHIWQMGDASRPEVIDVPVRRYTYATTTKQGYTASVSSEAQDFRVQATVYPLPSPRNTPYGTNFFEIFFTGGGSVPIDFLVPAPPDPNQPPPNASLLTVQHAYAASFDLDLAPVGLAGANFHSDLFDRSGEFTGPNGHSANRSGGFKDEDYNYQVSQGDQPGQWSLAAECGYAIDDDIRHPHPRPGASGDCKDLPRFRLACNLGPQILPATPAEVFAVPASGRLPEIPDPQPGFGLGFEASGIALNRSLRLVTGPLAALSIQGAAQ